METATDYVIPICYGIPLNGSQRCETQSPDNLKSADSLITSLRHLKTLI